MAIRLESGRREIGARTCLSDESVLWGPELISVPTGRQRSGAPIWATVVLAVLVSLALSAPTVTRIFGYRTLVVTGGSMAPLAKPGDVFVLKPVAQNEVRVGDLITFQPLTMRVLETHRVVRIVYVLDLLHFQTKGDANPTPDANLVPAQNVLGRADLHVPAIGRVYVFAASKAGRLLLVVVPALVLIIGEVSWALRAHRRRTVRTRRLFRSVMGRAVGFVLCVMMVLAIAGPAAALFSSTVHLNANSFTSGSVNAANLTGATAGLLPCRVDLTWTAPATGFGPDGYDVLRATVNGGPYSFVKHVGVVTSTSDTTVTSNKTYFYVLQSTRNSWTSANSNQRSATTAIVCV